MNEAEKQAQEDYRISVKENERLSQCRKVSIYLYDRGGLWLRDLGMEKDDDDVDTPVYRSIQFSFYPQEDKNDISTLADDCIRQNVPGNIEYKFHNPFNPQAEGVGWYSDFYFLAEIVGNTFPDTSKKIEDVTRGINLVWKSRAEIKRMAALDTMDEYVYMDFDFLDELLKKYGLVDVGNANE